MRVAVTGINCTYNPGPGVPLARSLKLYDPNIEIIGLSYDVNDPGHFMPGIIDQSYILPYPSQGWEGIFEKIKQIHKKTPIDVIIPCLDAELPLMITFYKQLEDLGIKSLLPTLTQFGLRNKDVLSQFSQKIGFKHPETIIAKSFSEFEEILDNEKLSYPILVKGAYYKAYTCRTKQEAIVKFYEITAEWGFPILVQQMIIGEEINLIGLGDGKGSDLGMVSIKKLTTTDLGKIQNGVTISSPAMLESTKTFLKETNWRGPFEVECIQNNEGIYLIEINPRFPAWLHFSTKVGINLPERMIKMLTNQEYETHSHYPTGKLFLRFSDEIVTDITKISQLNFEKAGIDDL